MPNDLVLDNTSASEPAFKVPTIDNCEVLKHVGVDEPLFVLRAQDRYAPLAVMAWADAAQQAGVGARKVAQARRIANCMLAWQAVHGNKRPD